MREISLIKGSEYKMSPKRPECLKQFRIMTDSQQKADAQQIVQNDNLMKILSVITIKTGNR